MPVWPGRSATPVWLVKLVLLLAALRLRGCPQSLHICVLRSNRLGVEIHGGAELLDSRLWIVFQVVFAQGKPSFRVRRLHLHSLLQCGARKRSLADRMLDGG